MKRTIFVGLVTIVIVFLSGCDYSKKQENKDVGAETVKNKVQKLIDDGGGKTTIKEVVRDGDLYKIVLNSNGREQLVYVTKDGTKLIESAISFEEIEKRRTEAKKQEAETNKEIPQSDKPVVDLYVMSFCPFGNKAEDTIKPVFELLKNKVDFNFYYIVEAKDEKIISLHGQPEVDQNMREACVLKDYGKDKWLDFVVYVNANCGTSGECWEKGAKTLDIDIVKVNNCLKSRGTSLMKVDAEKSKAAGASGSPTMLINGVKTKTVYQYGNSEEYKNVICKAFINPPAECSKELSSQTSTTQGGSCGG